MGKEILIEEMANGPVGVREHWSYPFQSVPRKGEKGALSQDVISRVDCLMSIQC